MPKPKIQGFPGADAARFWHQYSQPGTPTQKEEGLLLQCRCGYWFVGRVEDEDWERHCAGGECL